MESLTTQQHHKNMSRYFQWFLCRKKHTLVAKRLDCAVFSGAFRRRGPGKVAGSRGDESGAKAARLPLHSASHVLCKIDTILSLDEIRGIAYLYPEMKLHPSAERPDPAGFVDRAWLPAPGSWLLAFPARAEKGCRGASKTGEVV
jgi:hypothetical protein